MCEKVIIDNSHRLDCVLDHFKTQVLHTSTLIMHGKNITVFTNKIMHRFILFIFYIFGIPCPLEKHNTLASKQILLICHLKIKN